MSMARTSIIIKFYVNLKKYLDFGTSLMVMEKSIDVVVENKVILLH